jgi:hypothetical protein
MYSAKKVIQKHTCKASDIIDLDKIWLWAISYVVWLLLSEGWNR